MEGTRRSREAMVENRVRVVVDPEKPAARVVRVGRGLGHFVAQLVSTRPDAGGLIFHCGAQPVWTHSNKAALIKTTLLIIAIRRYYYHGDCHSRWICCYRHYSYYLKGVDPCRPPPAA